MITIQDMVQREVNCCMSSLVAALANGLSGGAFSGAVRPMRAADELRDLCDQALELASPILDYEEAAIQDGCKHVGSESDRCMLFSRSTSITGSDVTRACTWGELCEIENIEPYDREVFEHWAVSTWFADKLEAKGEKVDKDFAGLCIWARTTTGQAIHADGVIEAIYADMASA